MAAWRHFLAPAMLVLLVARPADGATVRIAVAANFKPVLDDLVAGYREEGGAAVSISAGSTGMLYAQVRAGAPYDLFLAADVERPRRLEADGRIVPGTRRTYALGRLALWVPGAVVDGPDVLTRLGRGRIALADPVLAPYGRAARQVLEGLGLEEQLVGQLVRGQSVGQAWQFVASGAARGGFIARSQLGAEPAEAYWVVPAELHDPIEQQLVLLADSAAARGLLAFLASPRARARIEAAGYGVP